MDFFIRNAFYIVLLIWSFSSYVVFQAESNIKHETHTMTTVVLKNTSAIMDIHITSKVPSQIHTLYLVANNSFHLYLDALYLFFQLS